MKVLFTTPVLEHPAAGGPQLRIENSIKALSKISELHIISRVSRRSLGGLKAEAFYKQHCDAFVYAPKVKFVFENRFFRNLEFKFNKRFLKKDADFIIEYVEKNEIDIVWFGYGNISYDLMKEIKAKKPHLKIVCDTDSVWSRFILRELPYEKDEERILKIKEEGLNKEQEEKEWVQFCDVTTAVSAVDADYYKSLLDDKTKIKIFSNVIDLDTYVEKNKPPVNFQKPCIYLAGTFWDKCPMEKAARWVIKEVWPQILKSVPTAHFYIIGNRSNEILSDIDMPNITITGKLDSVLPYLQNVNVAIVPLFFESGTRFKILEAAACNIPIVSTTLGAEGIPVENNKNIILADTSQDFAAGIIKILEDREFARQLASNCRSLIKENYSIEKLANEGKEILDFLAKKKN